MHTVFWVLSCLAYFGSRAATITLMELSKSGSHNLFYNSLCQFVHTIGTRDRQLHCIGCRKGVHGIIHFSIILQNQRASPSQQRCAIIATCFSQPPLTLSPESQWDLDEREIAWLCVSTVIQLCHKIHPHSTHSLSPLSAYFSSSLHERNEDKLTANFVQLSLTPTRPLPF